MKHLFAKKSYQILYAMLIIIILFFHGCGSNGLPIENIKKSLKDAPDYSVILDDMKEEGNFFKEYFHKYRVVQPDKYKITKWSEVPEDFYKANEDFMGMVIAGKPNANVAPPGYNYVGNNQYGHWKDDGKGGNFWEFYGKYRLLSDLFGGWYRPVYRYDFDSYKMYKKQKLPYYGRNEFGRSGSRVKSKRPFYYKRSMAKKTSFADKVSNRLGRSKKATSSVKTAPVKSVTSRPAKSVTTSRPVKSVTTSPARKTSFADKVSQRSTTKKTSFANKVSNRVGRTRTTFRSGGSSGGK
ncbi:MAG: hypothetical protein GY749_43045 [Desulfobacteraceae bacterium]|nr:hypothetical protein [Desulfobacteraceae bacterium]